MTIKAPPTGPCDIPVELLARIYQLIIVTTADFLSCSFQHPLSVPSLNDQTRKELLAANQIKSNPLSVCRFWRSACTPSYWESLYIQAVVVNGSTRPLRKVVETLTDSVGRPGPQNSYGRHVKRIAIHMEVCPSTIVHQLLELCPNLKVLVIVKHNNWSDTALESLPLPESLHRFEYFSSNPLSSTPLQIRSLSRLLHRHPSVISLASPMYTRHPLPSVTFDHTTCLQIRDQFSNFRQVSGSIKLPALTHLGIQGCPDPLLTLPFIRPIGPQLLYLCMHTYNDVGIDSLFRHIIPVCDRLQQLVAMVKPSHSPAQRSVAHIPSHPTLVTLVLHLELDSSAVYLLERIMVAEWQKLRSIRIVGAVNVWDHPRFSIDLTERLQRRLLQNGVALEDWAGGALHSGPLGSSSASTLDPEFGEGLGDDAYRTAGSQAEHAAGGRAGFDTSDREHMWLIE